MDQAKPTFQYADVPLHHRDIRIFRLIPPTLDSPEAIKGEIFVTSLDHPCQFTALSYAWGNSGDQKVTIHVNGKDLTITPTLRTALCGVRRDSPLNLWIDQICINQADHEEKKCQVPLMGDIYTLSAQTIAWLGLPSGSTAAAVRYLERVGQNLLSLGFRRMTKQLQEQLLADEEIESAGLTTIPETVRNMKEKLYKLLDAEGNWHELEVLSYLDEFFGAPYFERGWIKQEVALPSSVLFKSGTHTIDGDVLYAGIRFHELHWQRTSKMTRYLLRSPLTPEGKKTMEIMLADRPGRDAADASLVLRARRRIDHDLSTTTLGSILSKFHTPRLSTNGNDHRIIPKFSDDKDRVYGFLGFASDAHTLDIEPQYSNSVSVEQVYVDAARRIIEAGDVDFLFLAHRSAPHRDLPSWVPDLRSVSNAPILTSQTRFSTRPFSAGTGGLKPLRTRSLGSADPAVLVLEGIQVDIITVVGSPWPIGADGQRNHPDAAIPISSVEVLVSWSISTMQQLGNHPLWSTDEQRARRAEAFWRVPVADHEDVGNTRHHSQRSTVELSKAGNKEVCRVLSLYHRVVRCGEPADVVLPLDEEEERSLEGLGAEERAKRRLEIQTDKIKIDGVVAMNYAARLSVLETRRGFLGKEGVVGIGPLEMDVGDVICVIYGATLPVVLRPLENRLYSYVGEVYCDGIMDGEALEWGRESQLFRIR
ncbi:hypothetical protein DL766_010171 [Monosporascus sp. MC13-8B]|uniref:Heterokaryon incompatibility domain-containing protein n=1 Tax=Monosporascus cannonballus TaxID=155416 RepID=A0ABY0H2N0_9PEZI|nr:hypothetical protein DL762_006227 [Monosporascus cannonballus]RYO99242.1 hypothetical protein DL763_001606 [Monosporascus cannonballus]RYP08731.1 hypothetical protein DL766_010171 [Monosporascus sp. MC13-8B]